jgi:hypothetical protein
MLITMPLLLTLLLLPGQTPAQPFALPVPLVPSPTEKAEPPLGARKHQTDNFVVDAPTVELAQMIGAAAEYHRKEQARLWLGRELPKCSKPTPVRVTVAVNGSGGATSFAFDNGCIVGMDMHIEGAVDRILVSVLPHEVMHSILAEHFRRPLPRWVDEGIAILAEDEKERARHDQLVQQILATPGRIMPLRRLFLLREYPRDVMVLYGQGYSICRFLLEAKDRATLLKFIEKGKGGDWDAALEAHYGFAKVEDLEKAWLAQLKRRSGPRVDADDAKPARKEKPPEEDGKQALIKALLKASLDADGEVAQNASLALSALGRQAVPALIEALAAQDKEKRAQAAYVLGRMGEGGRGKDAEEALSTLTRLLDDEETTVRRAASWAIRQIVGNRTMKKAEN